MKGIAILLNFFLPGVGSFFINQVGQGVAQLLIWGCGVILCFTIVGIGPGVTLMMVGWLWAIIGAAVSGTGAIPVQIVQQDTRQIR